LNFEGIEIRSVGLSFTLKIFVISRKPNLIEFFDPLSLNRTVLYKLPPASKLILFDWVRKSKTCNFFSVSTGGIQMFFIDENSMSLKKGPGVNTPIVNAWYDGVRQFLAVSFLESPAELKIFDLNKTDEGINFKNPTHVLTLNLSATDGQLPAFNTNSYYERSKKTEESNSTVVIDFINLYKECYILHIDSESGSLDLHEIGGSSIKTVKILAESSRESKSGRFRYNIVDNLLVIHYLLEQITSVIDVRKDAGAQVVFGAPSCLSFMIEDIVANDLMNFCNYFDDKQIEVWFKVNSRCIKRGQLIPT
jgi:hypothetical protein